jgi:hypothetical protein
MIYASRHAIEIFLSFFCNASPWPVITGPILPTLLDMLGRQAAFKVTGICEEFPKVHTHCP